METKAGSQLELMLLALLRQPAHGYDLIERLRSASEGALEFPEGTVYPALYRLERAGLLSSSDAVVAGRRRRVYRLSRKGSLALERRGAAWHEETQAVSRVLQGGADRVTT